MATPSFILGGEKGWPVKEGKLLGYAQDENGLYRPIPVNFTRNSKSWVTRNGTLLEKAANVPTIGGTGTGKLVLQPERENEVLDVNQVPTPSLTAPTIAQDGTYLGYDVYKIDFPDVSGGVISSLYYNLVSSISGDRNINIYAKASVSSDVILGFSPSTSQGEVVSVGTDWSRIDTNQTASSNTNIRVTRRDSYTDTDAITVWLAIPQCEDGDYPTEPIITNGAVTRLRGEAVLDNIKTIAGTTSTRFAVLMKAEGVGESIGGSNSYARFFKGSSTEQIRVDYTGNNNFRFRDSANGSYDNMGGVISSPTADKKMLFAVDGNIARVFYNGAKIGSDYSGAGWDIDKLIFGTGYTLTLETIEIYKDALTDAAAVALTTS